MPPQHCIWGSERRYPSPPYFCKRSSIFDLSGSRYGNWQGAEPQNPSGALWMKCQYVREGVHREHRPKTSHNQTQEGLSLILKYPRENAINTYESLFHATLNGAFKWPLYNLLQVVEKKLKIDRNQKHFRCLLLALYILWTTTAKILRESSKLGIIHLDYIYLKSGI